MLILTRRVGETLRIGDDVEVGVWAVTEQKTGLRDDAENLAPMLPEFPVRPDVAIQGGTRNPQLVA